MTQPNEHAWTGPVQTFGGDDAERVEINRQVEEWSGFLSKLEAASFCLSVAFAEAHIPFVPPKRTRIRLRAGVGKSWLFTKAEDIQVRVAEVGKALSIQVKYPKLAQAPLVRKAFLTLAQDAPSGPQLLRIFDTDHDRAWRELAHHIEHKGALISQSACLLAAEEATREVEAGFSARVDKVVGDLLEEAGGVLTLTEAATRMKMSKAAVHKKIKNAQALGLMRDRRLMLPACQFVELPDGSYGIVHGLAEVLHLFAEGREGPVSTLQWLLTPHPNLDATPMAALHAQDAEAVRRAAQTYLQLDDQD